MAEGYKTGGRTKGTPNRATADVIARLAELNCDPIEGMALLALDPRQPARTARPHVQRAGPVCRTEAQGDRALG